MMFSFFTFDVEYNIERPTIRNMAVMTYKIFNQEIVKPNPNLAENALYINNMMPMLMGNPYSNALSP